LSASTLAQEETVMRPVFAAFAITLAMSSLVVHAQAQQARDPGPRAGPAAAGAPLGNLTAGQQALFQAGLAEFTKVDQVADDGLGPRMNLDSCAGCHSRPAIGGSSPDGVSEPNPQVVLFEQKLKPGNTTDVLPSFITKAGPVREVRLVKNPDGTADGGVQSLFTITGLPGADGCKLGQPAFAQEYKKRNVIFRIPTPVFGGGLIEQIPDHVIVDNFKSTADVAKTKLRNDMGIKGHLNIINAGHTIAVRANRNGNDGTIARFGWKAQNKSLLVFAGEAYNVEMGVTNELFQTERDETPECQFVAAPNDTTNPAPDKTGIDVFSDIDKFAGYMRFLAPPAASKDSPGGAASIASGSSPFADVGCALCHTPSLMTGRSTVQALDRQPVNLYSDIALHDMGKGLADGISQGQANGREFRTAPLWGLGQRAWLLHDGRTNDLIQAIRQHSSPGSEARLVVKKFNELTEPQKQDLLNFLRSL